MTRVFNTTEEILSLKNRVADLEHTLRIAAGFVSASVKHFSNQHPDVALKWLMDEAEKDRNNAAADRALFPGSHRGPIPPSES